MMEIQTLYILFYYLYKYIRDSASFIQERSSTGQILPHIFLPNFPNI